MRGPLARAVVLLATALAAGCGGERVSAGAPTAPGACGEGSAPTGPGVAPASAAPAAVEIRLDPELKPDRALVATIILRGPEAAAVKAFALEALPADVRVASAKDAAGALATSVEAAPEGRSVIRLARDVNAPLELTVRVRAEAPAPSTKPLLGIDDNVARIPGEVIPLPEPLGASAVDLRFILGQLDHHKASGGSTFAAANEFRGTATLAAVRHSYSLLVDGDLGTARFHTFEGDDHAAWHGYTSYDPRWVVAESAGVRGAVDRYLGAQPGGQHAIMLVSDRRKELPFAMVPRAFGLWISADLEAPWDATPLLRVSQHFAQKLVGSGLWIGERGGPREPAGWFWSEGVSRVVGRESLFLLGLIGFDDVAAEHNAALAETTLSPLRKADLDALVTAANAGGDTALEARRMLAARGILWASGLDARLRARSKGSKDLREVMRAVLVAAAKTRRDTATFGELATWIGEAAGADEQAVFQQTIVGGEPAATGLPTGAAGTCHKLETRKLSRFELGFEWTPTAAVKSAVSAPPSEVGVVKSVKQASAAERAGVRTGDHIVEMKYTPGRGDVAAKLKLERDGKALDVSFLPHGEEREGPIFVRKKGAKDESCTR